MLILGIHGSFSKLHQDIVPNLPVWSFHDAAAVLLDDGEVVAAVEEERLNRIKHTNKFCLKAVRSCLEQRGARLADIDAIAFGYTEAFTDIELNLQYLQHRGVPLRYARGLIVELLEEEFGERFPAERVHFVPHHLAHAYSTLLHTDFDEALVVVMDGQGDAESMTVLSGRAGRLEVLKTFAPEVSLGFFYRTAIEILGYTLFDEYKVMGLAPYGRPERYRELFQSLYRLLPGGDYSLDLARVPVVFLEQGFTPRRKGEEFTQDHKDFAAAVQETLEVIGLHVIGHWREATGHTRLCMAGGVAHNCSLNGKLLYSGLFEQVFVHPASHDGGSALGAAMRVLTETSPHTPARLRDVYWGADVGPDRDVEALLQDWSGFVSYERLDDVAGEVARLLAGGAAVGWVQGRSEFGPRALGNRSILADPRPAENKSRINAMVKKREGYRPFAPAVLAEAAERFFVLPQAAETFAFMVFTVLVREEQRELLGAITHVDGTARIQTVSRQTNPRFWELIQAFGELTGTPMLLNTSFNNNVEPIVDSALDALVCYLTTGLDYLVINDLLVRKLPASARDERGLTVALAPAAKAREVALVAPDGAAELCHQVYMDYAGGRSRAILPATYGLIKQSQGRRAVGALLDEAGASPADAAAVIQNLVELWEDRYIVLRPAAAA